MEFTPNNELHLLMLIMIWGVIVGSRNLKLHRPQIMLLVAGIVALRDQSISWQAGLVLFVMNACCNGPFTFNASYRKMQENVSCQQLGHIAMRVAVWQDRPYNDDSTASRLLSEVKHHRARLVLRWGTTLESLVLIFCLYFPFQHFELTIMSGRPSLWA